MSEQEKVTRAEVDDMWNRFQDEVIAHAHDSTRREQLIKERLPELRSMIERCDNITGNRQDLFSQLSGHVSKLGLEAMPTRLSLLYFENNQGSSTSSLTIERDGEDVVKAQKPQGPKKERTSKPHFTHKIGTEGPVKLPETQDPNKDNPKDK